VQVATHVEFLPAATLRGHAALTADAQHGGNETGTKHSKYGTAKKGECGAAHSVEATGWTLQPPQRLQLGPANLFVGLARIELATSTLSVWRSNQLSYSPEQKPSR
jgi:hypothetical protein